MNHGNQIWRRLASAARRAPAPDPRELPDAMAGRIVARWLAGEREDMEAVWTMAGRRVLAGALALTTGILALSYFPLNDTWAALTNSAPLLEVMAGL